MIKNVYVPTVDPFQDFKAFKKKTEENFSATKDVAFEKRYHTDDPYLKYPTRLLGYTDELAVVVQPILGPYASIAGWIPSIGYFGADVVDKYSKGIDDKKPDVRPAISRGVFHLAASVFAPTLAIHYMQEAALKYGGKKWINSIQNKMANGTSKWLNKASKCPIGSRIAKAFGDSTELSKPKPLTGWLNAINKLPIMGEIIINDPIKEYKELTEMGIKTQGAKRLAMSLKTVVGLITLAATAKIIDMLTENLLIKKAVNPALGLRNEDFRSSLH